jgi:hypothetical protein
MKMNDSPNFCSDPKVIISLLALLVSIFALLWTLANQRGQNRRWDKLNAANPEIKEIKMTIWKEVTKDEAMNIQWGYKPLIYVKAEATNIYTLPYYLSLYDSETNQRIARANPVFTITEAENELKRIDHKNKVFIFKFFRPLFIVENMGKTVAENLSIKVDAKLPNQEWQPAFTSNAIVNLSGGQTSLIYFDFELPFELELPKQINFRINFQWEDSNNKIFTKIIGAKWTTVDNFWSYENYKE